MVHRQELKIRGAAKHIFSYHVNLWASFSVPRCFSGQRKGLSTLHPAQDSSVRTTGGPPKSLAQKTHHNAQGAPRALPGSCPFPLVPFQSPAFQLSAVVGRKNSPPPETLQSMPQSNGHTPPKRCPLRMIFSFHPLPDIPSPSSLRHVPYLWTEGHSPDQKRPLPAS